MILGDPQIWTRLNSTMAKSGNIQLFKPRLIEVWISAYRKDQTWKIWVRNIVKEPLDNGCGSMYWEPEIPKCIIYIMYNNIYLQRCVHCITMCISLSGPHWVPPGAGTWRDLMNWVALYTYEVWGPFDHPITFIWAPQILGLYGPSGSVCSWSMGSVYLDGC